MASGGSWVKSGKPFWRLACSLPPVEIRTRFLSKYGPLKDQLHEFVAQMVGTQFKKAMETRWGTIAEALREMRPSLLGLSVPKAYRYSNGAVPPEALAQVLDWTKRLGYSGSHRLDSRKLEHALFREIYPRLNAERLLALQLPPGPAFHKTVLDAVQTHARRLRIGEPQSGDLSAWEQWVILPSQDDARALAEIPLDWRPACLQQPSDLRVWAADWAVLRDDLIRAIRDLPNGVLDDDDGRNNDVETLATERWTTPLRCVTSLKALSPLLGQNLVSIALTVRPFEPHSARRNVEFRPVPPHVWRIGDAVQIVAEADRDCFMTIINVGSEGDATVLFPNPDRSDSLVRRGEPLICPADGDRFKLELAGPPGKDVFIAIATSVPVSFVLHDDDIQARNVAFVTSDLSPYVLGAAEVALQVEKHAQNSQASARRSINQVER